MLRHTYFLPLTLLLTLIGCDGGHGQMKAQEYKGRFEDLKHNLVFQCPADWDIRENIEGHRVIARSPRTLKDDLFQENLVVTGPINASSLENARTQAESEFKKLDNYKALAAPGDILDFDYRFNQQDLHGRVYLCKIKDKDQYWLAQFTDAKSDFPSHEAVFVGIMASWGLLPGSSPTPVIPAPLTSTPALDANATPAPNLPVSSSPAASSPPASATPPTTVATPPH